VTGFALLRYGQPGPADLDDHRLGGLPRELPIGRREGGLGTRSRNRFESPLFPDGRARALEDFRTMAGLRTWLQRAMA
jgi:hypothetical protein